MISYKEISPKDHHLYDAIPMQLIVTSIYQMEKIQQGLGGILLIKTPVKPRLKDFNALDKNNLYSWQSGFDLTNWSFFLALDQDKPIGGAALAARTKNLHMLKGREDLGILWDLRVHDEYKKQGIGQKLFDLVKERARAQGLTELNIECQNNNVPAIHFYHKQGAILTSFDERAYHHTRELQDEVQLIWTLTL